MKPRHFRRQFVLLLLTLTTACSSDKVINRNSEGPTEAVALSESGRVKADRPEAINPETRPSTGYAPFVPLGGTSMEAGAAVALVGTVIGLSRVLRAAQTRTDLNGSCTYGQPDAAVVSPCNNVTVNLLDSEKSIAASASTNQNGDFRFYIPAGKTYFVQVIDRKGRTASTKAKTGRSEVVSLFLKP